MDWPTLKLPPVNLWSMAKTYVREDMRDWYERACIELEQEMEDGLLTQKEFRQAMRDLNAEYEEEADKYRDSYYE